MVLPRPAPAFREVLTGAGQGPLDTLVCMTTKTTTLKNGLRIVTADLPGAQSLTVTIAAGTGSRKEDFPINGGVSHFLEHLLFKGSKRYPDAEVIAKAVDAVGGINNAYTTEDLTNYYIKVPKRHATLALDILADMVANPLLSADEIERERGVIIEEMNVYRDDPARYVSTLMPPLLFPGNPLGQDIIGSEEVILSIPRESIAEYQRTHYGAANLVVAAAGAVDHDVFVRQVEELMGELPTGTEVPFERVGAELDSRLAVVNEKATAQAHFIVAARGYHYGHPADPAAKMLATVLGRGMSSRLFIKVREREGLAYSVVAGLQNFVDTGIFEVYAGVNLDKADRALDSVLSELDRVRQEKVEEIELAKAREQLRASLEMSLESNSSVADRISTQMVLMNRVRSFEEMIGELEAVTADDVLAAAQDLLTPEKLRFAIIAPNPNPTAEHFAGRLENISV